MPSGYVFDLRVAQITHIYFRVCIPQGSTEHVSKRKYNLSAAFAIPLKEGPLRARGEGNKFDIGSTFTLDSRWHINARLSEVAYSWRLLSLKTLWAEIKGVRKLVPQKKNTRPIKSIFNLPPALKETALYETVFLLHKVKKNYIMMYQQKPVS